MSCNSHKPLRKLPLFTLWLVLLLAGIMAGLWAYWFQLQEGMHVTGLSRHASWGLYIGTFTFAVGIAAASAITALSAHTQHRAPLPCDTAGNTIPDAQRLCSLPDNTHPTLHSSSALPLTLFAEGMAIAALVTALLCVIADMGRPQNLLNLLLHPSPSSPMFWDMLALCAYLLITLVLYTRGLEALRQRLMPSPWMRVLLCVSVPLAISIHLITAFLYAGLPDRHYWLTSVLGARFLASAFCSGPALLLLGLRLLHGIVRHDPLGQHGPAARRLLTTWTLWALIAHCLLFGMELFTAYYSGIPALRQPFTDVFTSSGGAWFTASWLLALAALCMLLWERHTLSARHTPGTSRQRGLSPLALCAFACTVCAVWIDKAPGMMRGGFTPSPFGETVTYSPTFVERTVLLGILCFALLILSIAWRFVTQECRNSHA